MSSTDLEDIVLSICVRCRDGREEAFEGVRGGARFAEAVAAKLSADVRPSPELRGVRCMSQCKRACTISLTAPNAFTWIFGDLDPQRHANDVIELIQLYRQSPDGFLARHERPEAMRAGVLGRLPPIASEHEVVEKIARPAEKPSSAFADQPTIVASGLKTG